MESAHRFEIAWTCEKLSIAYAQYVDFRRYDAFADLFAIDGVLDVGQPLVGREAIRQAMHQRSDKLRSRHVLSNIHIEVANPDRATGISYLSLYRYYGPQSLVNDAVDLEGPAAIGHYSDEFVRTDAGWRFSRRELNFAFRNPKYFKP